jgi:hypothetical protein
MRRYRWTYIGAVGVAVAGCVHGLRSIAPVGLAFVSPATVRTWVEVYAPKTQVLYHLHWAYQTDQGAAKGRASIRVAPPDSLRFDFRGPFGKSGAAVVIGDSGIWAKPQGDLKELLRAAPLFWAALGMPSPPGPMVTVTALQTPQRRAWRYAGVADTFDFVEYRTAPRRLLAELRRGGKIAGFAEALFDSSQTQVASARLEFPGAPARFTFSVDSVNRTESFGPDVWRQP